MQSPIEPDVRDEAPATSPFAATPLRRRALLVTSALVAAGAGAALAWRRVQPHAPEPAVAVPRLWSQTFDTPDGGTLAMADLRGRPLLLNFWATWCPPCVEELPLLDQFARLQAQGQWQVVGLAVDQPGAVRKFLLTTPVAFPIGLAGLGGAALGKELGNMTGGLPFTAVLDRDGAVAARKMGQIQPADLSAWAAAQR